MDANATQHDYPRLTDPVANNVRLPIIKTTASTFTVNVGSSPLKHYTPTGVDYQPDTGVMSITIGPNNLNVGEKIRFKPQSLVFTCDPVSYTHLTLPTKA